MILLWGNSNWRANRDRVLRLSQEVIFKRVDSINLKKIAKRILEGENIGIDQGALEVLVENNIGDLRSLIHDLQALSATRIWAFLSSPYRRGSGLFFLFPSWNGR